LEGNGLVDVLKTFDGLAAVVVGADVADSGGGKLLLIFDSKDRFGSLTIG
jgi:hypothetical protein